MVRGLHNNDDDHTFYERGKRGGVSSCVMDSSLPKATIHSTNSPPPPLQGGITCGAIEDPRKSSKAIDERVIINFRDKNVVIARFRDKNVYR